MKNLLILIFITLKLLFPFDYGTFEYNSDWDNYRLVLKKDSTFEFHIPALTFQYINGIETNDDFTATCVEHGIWKIVNDTLILIDSVIKIYDKTSIDCAIKKSQHCITVKVKDKKGNPLKNTFVSINYSRQWKKTDSIGVCSFNFNEIEELVLGQSDTINFQQKETILLFSIYYDSIVENYKFKKYNIREQIDEKKNPVLVIMVTNSKRKKDREWLKTFDVTKNQINDFELTLDFNPEVRYETRIRKLPIENNCLIYTRISNKNEISKIRLTKKE